MACRFIVHDGILLNNINVLPASQFLASTHPGAYTTTRTGGQGSCVLLWERHLLRLCQSLRLLSQAKPQLYPAKPLGFIWPYDDIRSHVQFSLNVGLPKALEARENVEDELAITTLVSGASVEGAKPFDVHVHVASYSPPSIANSAHLVIVGPGRENACAKSSEWVRVRQGLERFRSPSTTELLLSNDGERLLEGTISNFFVVCYQETRQSKDEEDVNQRSARGKWTGYEVHTAPIIDGVLPGVVRQLVIEICADEGIPLREISPSWSNRHLWKEAFITNSLRLVQHVESIQASTLWSELFHAKSWKELSWEALQFEKHGLITQEIQKLVMERAISEGYKS